MTMPLTRPRRRPRLLSALGLALGVGAAAFLAAPGAASAQTPDYSQRGPHEVEVQEEATNTYYSPAELDGAHPVILWGNGTITQVSWYDGYLRHLASHGLIVAAANTSNAGSGNEMLNGLDELTAWNGESGNRFYQHVDLGNVGSTGHSQGGGGSINAAKDERVKTTFPLEPWSQNETGLQNDDTAMFFAGENDTVVPSSSVRARYEGVSIPAGFAELAGADHLTPLSDAGGFRGASTAWALWQLTGDTAAQSLFVGADCGLCTSSDWSAYEANAQLGSAGGGSTPPSEEAPPPDEGEETPPPSDDEGSGSWFLDWLNGLFGGALGGGDDGDSSAPTGEAGTGIDWEALFGGASSGA
jgi:Chlorophyllase enzyme